MRLGIGGGAFGVRGGISTRGIGVGVGPLSAGTSWRGRGSSRGNGGFLAFLVAAVAIILIVAWPYLLGTYIAVKCGAWNPSTERFVVGWCFEVVYVAVLVAWFIHARAATALRRANEARQMAALTESGEVYETNSGRSTVFRHGTCTVNHRSRDTAASCTKSAPTTTAKEPVTTAGGDDSTIELAHANKQATIWGSAILVVGLVAGLVILLVDPIHSAAEDAASKPCPATTSVASASASTTVPDVVGENAGVAENQLKAIGLTVNMASANPAYKSVWVPSNWTVVSTDPASGCTLSHGTSVTLYVMK